MMRLLAALLLALAPLAAHAQEAEPMDGGVLGTGYSAGELCLRGTCLAGSLAVFYVFMGNACGAATASPTPHATAPAASRRGVGDVPETRAPDSRLFAARDLLLSPDR